jgi:hypothetical protein
MLKPKETLYRLHAVDRRAQIIRFALALCVAAALVYAIVQLGLWRGVVKLN